MLRAKYLSARLDGLRHRALDALEFYRRRLCHPAASRVRGHRTPSWFHISPSSLCASPADSTFGRGIAEVPVPVLACFRCPLVLVLGLR